MSNNSSNISNRIYKSEGNGETSSVGSARRTSTKAIDVKKRICICSQSKQQQKQQEQKLHHQYPNKNNFHQDNHNGVDANHDIRASGNNNTVLCSACCQRALRESMEENQKARKKWMKARNKCSQRFQEMRNDEDDTDISELQYESQALRNELLALRKKCSDLAITVTSMSIENDHRKEQLNNHYYNQQQQQQQQQQQKQHQDQSVEPESLLQRDYIYRLEDAVTEGGLMKYTIQSTKEQIRILRFTWALQAFRMHRLYIEENDYLEEYNKRQQRSKSRNNSNNNTTDQSNNSSSSNSVTNTSNNNMVNTSRPRGIGKIGGLPLPNAGPELYSVLPPQELQSALRLVASLTSLIATCLGILLPHPILLQTMNSSNNNNIHNSDIIHYAKPIPEQDPDQSSAMQQQQQQQQQQAIANSKPKSTSSFLASSTSSLLSLVDFTWGGGGATANNSKPKSSPVDTTRTGINTTNNMAPAKTAPSRTRTGYNGQLQALQQGTNNTIVIPPSMDPSLISLRLRHATAAIIAEKNYNSNDQELSISKNYGTQYALSVPDPNKKKKNINNDNHMNNTANSNNSHNCTNNNSSAGSTANNSNIEEDNNEENFAIALQLLQNNVIALCIRAGVPVSNLWPAEALLLNLNALQFFCQEQVVAEQ